jgi:hypothetical protein
MKKWMKVLLGVVGALVGIFAIAIGAVFFFTSGMVDTADAFFAALKANDFRKAHTFLAAEFKASTDEKALREFLSRSSITSFKESSWSNRQVSGGRGELVGSITTDTGGVVPLKLTFVKENGDWKIYALQKPSAGLQTESSSRDAPSKDEAISLVKRSIHDFAVSADKRDMTHFYGTLSALWQGQVTTAKLNDAFKPIMDSGATWSVLDRFDPVLSADGTVDEHGVLVLAGHYPTKPNQVYFQQKYVYEGVTWKLVGFNIHAK